MYRSKLGASVILGSRCGLSGRKWRLGVKRKYYDTDVDDLVVIMRTTQTEWE